MLYFFRDPKTFHDCVNFICRLQYIFCCNGFYVSEQRFVFNKWTRFYSLGFAGFIYVSLGSSIYYLLQDSGLRARLLAMDKLVLSILVLEVVMSTYVSVVTVLSLQAAAQRHLSIYHRLAMLDERLIKDYGANMNYHKLLRKNIAILMLVTVLYLGAIFSAATMLGRGHRNLLLFTAFCYAFATGGPHFTGYIHMNLAELLGIRFRLLQQIIQPSFLRRRFPKEELLEQQLRSAVEMIKELHFLIREVNDVCKYGLWASMAHDFTLTTSELFIIFGYSADHHVSAVLLIYVALGMMPPFYKMLVAPVYCDRTVRSGKKCLRLVELLDDWFPGSPSIKQLVEAMMSWRLEFKIEFQSGLGIVLNKTVITTFTSTVFNYLLILIQFAMVQKMGQRIELSAPRRGTAKLIYYKPAP